MKNSTCSRSSATVSRSREFSAVCQLPVISLRIRSQICRVSAAVRDSPSRPSSSCAIFCCLRRIVRRVDSVGCAVNTGSIQISIMRRRISSSPSPCALQARHGFDDAARLRRAFVQILAAAADAMDLLRHVDHFEPQRERAHQVARLRGRNVARAGRELAGALGAAVAPRDRGLPILLDCFEQGIAALLADHLADQRAEHVHVFAQLGVFQRKGNVGARHGRVSERVRASLAERLLRWSHM